MIMMQWTWEEYGGSEWATSRCASVVYELFWAKGKFSLKLKGNFCFSIYVEELELGALPKMRDYHA